MDDVKTPSSEERKSALSGLGTSRKRVEDARFTPVSYTHLTLPTRLPV